MRTLATLALLLVTLTGCAETVYKPVEVDVPVTVPCKHQDITHPDFPLHSVPQTATIFDKTKAALIEIDYRQVYEDELAAALKGCGG